MKLSLIHSVGLIAKAISKSVRKQGYLFSRKQELMGVMMVRGFYMKIIRVLIYCMYVFNVRKIADQFPLSFLFSQVSFIMICRLIWHSHLLFTCRIS